MVRHYGQIVLFDGVLAEVCDACGDVLLLPVPISHSTSCALAKVCGACGDVLLRPETIHCIERLIESQRTPKTTDPLYEYA